MGRMTMSQEIAVACFTFLGGFLSLLGSGTIIYSVLQRIRITRNSRDVHTYHRLLLMLSFCDVFASIGWFMAPISAPADSSPRHLAIGSVDSCTVTGLFLQFGVGGLLYNGCLSLYFLMTIRYGVSKENMIWRERIMHAACLTFAFVSAVTPLPFELYNELGVGTGCWFTYYPQFCDEDPEVDCIRGTYDPVLFGYAFGGVPFVVSMVTVTWSNILVYRTAKQMATRVGRHSIVLRNRNSNFISDRQARRKREIAMQATSYVAVFVNSSLWNILLRQLDGFDVITSENESSWTPLILVSQFFASSAGFGFLVTYLRPRYLRFRERGYDRYTAIHNSLFSNDVKDARRSTSGDGMGYSRSRASSRDDGPDFGGRRRAVYISSDRALQTRNQHASLNDLEGSSLNCFGDNESTTKTQLVEYEAALKCSELSALPEGLEESAKEIQ